MVLLPIQPGEKKFIFEIVCKLLSLGQADVEWKLSSSIFFLSCFLEVIMDCLYRFIGCLS
jgi:hypothetical protein